MTSISGIRQLVWLALVAAASAALIAGAAMHSHRASPFVAHALGPDTPTAPLQRPMLADALQHVTTHGVRVSTHGQRIGVALAGAQGAWTRHANGVERTLPYGRESIVLTKLTAEELVTVDRRLGTRTWRWRLDASVEPTMKSDGSVGLRTHGLSRLAILPVAILDGSGRNVTPAGLRWRLERSRGSTWLTLRLADRSLPLPYVIDPNIALTGTCPNSAGQTDLSGTTTGSAVAQSCSVATQSGTNGSTSLVMTAPSVLANGNVMIAHVTARTTTVVPTPAGWTQIGTTQTNGTLAQYLYYRVASGDTGGTTTWTWTVATKADLSGGIVALSGVDTTNPVDAVSTSGTTGTGTPATATAPAVTTAVANDQVLAFYATQAGVTLSSATYGGAAATKLWSAASKANPTSNESDSAGVKAASLQATVGSTGTSTVSLSAAQPWIAQTLALRTAGPTSVTFAGSRTKAGARSTWTVGFTTTSGGALAAGNTVTITFPAAWTGIPASPAVTFGGSFAGCGAGATGSTAGTVVTVTLPSGCTLANSAAGTVAIAGITNPAAGTYTNTGFLVHTSQDISDNSPASSVVITAATTPTSVGFAGSRTKAGATSTWTATFTATTTGSLAAGDIVVVTFPSTWTGIPSSPAVTFGGSFAGCAAGATGSTSSGVVTVTLPTGCTLANSASGSVAIAGITNPAAATYTNTTFKVHTSSDTTDASPASSVTVGAATTPTAVSFSGGSTTYAASTTWTVGFTATATGSLAAGDVVTVTFDTGFASGLPASPAVTFGGSFAGCAAGATGSTASNVVTVTLPSGCTLANSAAGTLAIAGITNPTPATYTSTNFKVHTSSDATDASPASSVTISKKNLTISGATASNKVYDGTTTATLSFGSASLSGVVGADVVSIDSSAASGTFASKTVGTGKTVTVTGVALTGANAGNYTVSQPSGLTANITTKSLTITGVTASNKVYDGTTAATLGGTASLSGVVAGDTVTLGGTASGTFADKNVGTAKTVTVTGYTISGTDAANYSLTQPSPTANITAKSLTITGVTASNKVYDATTAATLGGTPALSGVVAGDTVTLGGTASGTFADKNVGTAKTVTVTGYTISGADAGNYSLTQPSPTANITAKSVTVSGITASNKVYDQATSATLNTSGASLSGVVAGDTASLVTTSATGAFSDKNVGAGKTVTVSGLSLSGADAGNYSITAPTTTANITAKSVTVSGITAANKVYDQATTATINTSGASLSGVIAGDTASLVTTSATGAFSDKNVGTGKTVTISGLSLSGADAGNYSITAPTTTANITAKSVTVSGITASNKVYDRTTSATINTSGASLSGVIAGDTASLVTTSATGAFSDKNVGTGKTVTISGLSLSGADAGDYSITAPTTTANITAKSVTVSGITASNKVYDQTTAATINTSGASLSGVIAGDTASLVTTSATGAFADKTVAVGKTVTIGGLSLSGADAGNYTITAPTTTANITAKALTVNNVTAQNKSYDGTTAATLNTGTASFSGVIAGDTVLIDTSAASGTFASKHVGTGIAVTVTGIAATGADAGNYTVTQPATTANITAKTLTISGATGNTKVYDRTTTATVNFSSATLNGVVGGDSVSIDASSATFSFSDKNVGAGKAITASGVALTGTSAGDYTVSQPAGLTGTITAAPITVTGVTAQNKVYDRTTTATLTGTASLSGVIAGDTVTVGGSPTASFADKTVATNKPVTVNGYTISGADSGNYTLSQPTGLTATITPAPLTVTGVTAANKVYDGTTAATLGGTPALSGVIAGDTVTLGGTATGTFVSKTVGTGKTVNVTGYTLGGADAGNYSLTQPSPTANITVKSVTVSGVTASNKVYDQTTAATINTGSAAISGGVVGGDTVALVTTSATGAFSDKNVGTGKTVTISGLSLSGADAGNYTITPPTTTANITAKALTVNNVTAQSKTYDGTTTAAVNTGTATFSGVIAGDTVLIDTSAASGAFASKHAGTAIVVTVTGIGATGPDATDYTVTQPSTTANITPKSLTISGAVGNGKVYDGTPTATADFSSATLNGVVGGDSVSIDASAATFSFANKNVGTGKAITANGVGLAGTSAADYTVSQPTGLTATIVTKSLTVSGAVANNKAYDGTTAATVDFTGASLTGVAGGDAVTLVSSGYSASFASSAAGTGIAVTVTGVALGGADAGNYTVTQPAGLTANITGRAVAITGVAAVDKTYDGSTAAALDTSGAALSGVLNGDDVQLVTTGASAQFNTKDVGAGKAVTVTGFTLTGADAPKYQLSQPSGLTATITKKALTVSGVTAQNKTYDGTTSATLDTSGAALVGVVGSDAVTLGGTATGTFSSAAAGAGKPVAVTGFTLGGADAGDYTLTQPTATATIAKKALTVSGVTAQNKTYDGTTSATLDTSGAALVGIVGSDAVTLGGTATGTFADKLAASNKPVTVTGFTLGGADAGNYTLTQPTPHANIVARTLTVTGITAASKVYDSTANAALVVSSPSLVGVAGGDSVTLSTSGATGVFGDKNVGNGKTVTVSGVSIGGADAGNYLLVQPSPTADITRASLTVSGVTAADKVYDRSTTATLDTSGAQLQGVFAGDTVTLNGTATGAFATAAAGANKTVAISGFSLGGGDAGNYSLTQPTATASITKKPLTISGVTANDKVYDGTTGATLDTSSAALVGLVAGDTVTLGGTATGAFADKNIGSSKSVAVAGFALTGADAGNYSLTQPTTSASITKKSLTVSGVTADDKFYDGSTSAAIHTTGATLVGAVGGDAVTLGGTPSGTFADKNVGSGKTVSISGFSLAGADAGNYALAQPTTTASIVAASLAVSGVTASDKVYDGTTAATLNTSGAALVGVVGGDTVNLSGTPAGAFVDKTAGAGKTVSVSGYTLSGADAGNYVLTPPTTTASITKKALTIAGVTAQSKVYDGTAAAALDTSGESLVGKVAGDVVGIVDGSGTFADKHVGTSKAVTATGFGLTGGDAGNYTVAQPSSLAANVTARPLTVSAQADTKVYDGTTSSSLAPQITTGSLVAGDAGNFTQAFATATVGTNKAIVPSGAVTDGNGGNDYTVTFVNATGTIMPGAPARLAFTQAPPTATGGQQFATQPQVSIEDSYGNLITTDSSTRVTLAVGTNPSGGTLGCATSGLTVTVSNGVASFAGCKIDRSGTGYTLAASNNAGLTNATSASFNVVVGGVNASGSSVSGPATVVADGSTAGSVTVTLKDDGDNAVAGKTVSLAQDNGKHATITPTTAVTDANGRATFAVRDQTQEVVTFTATDVDDSVTVTQTASVSFVDTTPPAITIGAPTDGVQAAGNLVLTATGVSDGETGVQGVSFSVCNGSCQTFAGSDQGGGTWAATVDTTTLANGRTYTWSATASDKAGNSTTSGTRSFSVDNSPPTIGLAPPTLLTPGIEYYDGAAATPTLWLNSTGSGQFTLNATASDPESGVAKVHFPALLGTPAHDVTGSSPYQSNVYSFTNQSSNLTGNSIVATNGVSAGDGVNTASTAFDVKVDGAAPTTTMDPTLNGKVVASGVLVGATSSDAGSGVAQVSFVYCDRSANPVCNPASPIGTAATPTLGTYQATWTMSGLTDGHQYAVAAVGTDNVGNSTTSAIVTVTVDNSAPAVAFQAPTTTGSTYFDGTKLWVNAAGGGTYTLHVSATDAQSGISAVTFNGADAGTTSGGGTYDSPSYSNDGTAATMTVAAANGVQLPSALTASAQLQRAADGTAPTTNIQFPVDNGGYDSTTWPTGSQACSGTQPEGLCGTVADLGAGVKKVELTLEDLGGGKYYDGAGFSAGATTLAATQSGNTWSYPLDHSKLGTGTFELKFWATDKVGNVEAVHTIQFQYGNDLAPPNTQLSLTSATHAYLMQVGSHPSPNAGNDYALYYSTAGSGGFKLHASSTDVSGIDHITFPAVFGTSSQTQTNGSAANPWTIDSAAYSFGASDTTPPAQADVVSVDTAIPRANSGDDTITFLLDNTSPTGGSVSVSPIDASAYATTTSLTLSHVNFGDGPTGSGMASNVLTVASAGLSDGTCGTFGSASPVTDGSFSATNGTCYQFTLTGTDNVGNVATATQVVKVDTTAPATPTVAFSGLSAGNTYDTGTGTLWYRPSTGGTFSITAASSDAESGIKPGNAGYTFSSQLGGTQTGGRLDVAFGAGGVGSGTYTVDATNRAGLDSGNASFTVNADSAAPANGALKVNGTDATAGGSSSYLTTGSSVAIDARTDYTDAGSGLAASTLTMEVGTLANNTCSSYGAPSTIAGTAAQSVGNGHCYRFTLTGSDHVGNTASLTTVVMVDTTPPTTTGVAFSGLSAGNTYDAGNGTLWYRPSASGTFTATLTGAADPETGIAGSTFPSLTGFSTASQSGNALSVTFDGSSTGGGSYGAVAKNGAGVDSAPAPFTVTADTTAPANGLLSTSPYSASLTVALGEQDFTDSGSGIASNALTRSDPVAPSAPGSCPAAGYTGATAVAVSGGSATDTVPVDGKCYEYTLTGTDRVGNVATYKTIVLVDTTPASGGTVDQPNGVSSNTKISVDWDPGVDAESGIQSVDVQRASAPVSGATCGSFGSFSTIVTNATTSPLVDGPLATGQCYQYRILVKNFAGVTATFTSPSVTQLTNASPIDATGTATYVSGSTLYVGPAATSFGLQLTADGQQGVTSADWSAGSGTIVGTGSTASTAPFASGSYTWAGTPSGTVSVTRQPTGTVDSINVVYDGTAPTGSVNQPNGINPQRAVPVTTSGVGDSGSGVASVEIDRAETTLTGSTCGTTWSAFTPVTLTAGKDTSVQDEHCYQYRVVVTDNVGNQHVDTSANVVEIPDVTPPSFSSAATDVSGAHLTITMSEPLDSSSTPSASRFTVSYDGVAQPTPTSSSISGTDVVLGLASPPNNGQTVTVGYSSDGSLRDLATPSANSTPSFGPVAVTNDTPDTVAPSLSSADVNGSTVTLHFGEALAGSAPDAGAFTVTVNGTTRAATAVSLGGTTATLALGQPVDANDTVVVGYAVPALNALHDGAGNTVKPFTTSVTNNTPVAAVSTPPSPTPTNAPFLLATSPADGSTVAAAPTVTLTADEFVAWTKMTLTRPNGSVVSLPDASGSTASYPLGSADQGLYVVHGTMTANGAAADVLTHFTIWTPSAGPSLPPVQKNGGGSAGSVATPDGSVVAAWLPTTFSDPVVVQLAPQTPASLALPPSTIVLDVTAFLRDTHQPVTQLGDVLDVQFPHAPAGAQPQQSEDGKAWKGIGALPTLQLPDGQPDGWFRDSDGTVHVLTRHLTYFALLVPSADTKLALQLTTPRRLWLAGRDFMAVRIVVTAPARVTGSFVAADGTVIPGQVIRTPTRRAGATILRVPLHVAKPGLYRLQVHAEGIGQTVDRTAKIRFVARRPASPVWQSGPLHVAMIEGLGVQPAVLASALGRRYVVTPVADADLYSLVDPSDPHAATAVVVDLDTVPLPSLASLHALLPELQIVGVTDTRATAVAARAVGVRTVVTTKASSPELGHVIKALITRR